MEAEETKQPANNPDDKGTGDKDFVNPSAKVKMKDGTEKTVEELQKGYMQEKDYTKGKQKIADIEKEYNERTVYFKDNPALAELEQKVMDGEIDPKAILDRNSEKPLGEGEPEVDEYEDDIPMTKGDWKKAQKEQDKKWNERETQRKIDEGSKQYMSDVNVELDKHREFNDDIDRMTGERLIHNFVREQQKTGRIISPHKLLVEATAHAIKVLKVKDEAKVQAYLDKKEKERNMPAVSGSTPIGGISKEKEKELLKDITGSPEDFAKGMSETNVIPESDSSLGGIPGQDSPFG